MERLNEELIYEIYKMLDYQDSINLLNVYSGIEDSRKLFSPPPKFIFKPYEQRKLKTKLYYNYK